MTASEGGPPTVPVAAVPVAAVPAAAPTPVVPAPIAPAPTPSPVASVIEDDEEEDDDFADAEHLDIIDIHDIFFNPSSPTAVMFDASDKQSTVQAAPSPKVGKGKGKDVPKVITNSPIKKAAGTSVAHASASSTKDTAPTPSKKVAKPASQTPAPSQSSSSQLLLSSSAPVSDITDMLQGLMFVTNNRFPALGENAREYIASHPSFRLDLFSTVSIWEHVQGNRTRFHNCLAAKGVPVHSILYLESMIKLDIKLARGSGN